MAEHPDTSPGMHASSLGQELSGIAWLDRHFEACRPEYEAQLRSVGIQPGWRVLDAACGLGSYLPWLAELVGPRGSLDALDLDPANVAVVERRVDDWGLPCPVEARIGNVLALPYPDGHFDAAWFANTSQYLSDDELATALAELRRVVRPGGLVAVKEADGQGFRVLPAPPGALARAQLGLAAAGGTIAHGVVRAPELPTYLRRAGLVGVRGGATPIERRAPLDVVARQFLIDGLGYFASVFADLPLPAADRAFWSGLREPAEVERLLDDPEFWFCEGNVLAVGTVPGEAA